MSKLNIKVKPLFVDMNGNVSVYIADASKEYADERGQTYKENVRFKVTRDDMEVYYGGDKWEKLDIFTVNPHRVFTKESVVKVIEDWWDEKEFKEDNNNV